MRGVTNAGILSMKSILQAIINHAIMFKACSLLYGLLLYQTRAGDTEVCRLLMLQA